MCWKNKKYDTIQFQYEKNINKKEDSGYNN